MFSKLIDVQRNNQNVKYFQKNPTHCKLWHQDDSEGGTTSYGRTKNEHKQNKEIDVSKKLKGSQGIHTNTK